MSSDALASDTMISVRDLSKAYTISHASDCATTLAEAIAQRVRHPLRRMERETFWAVKDVSFDVKRGDVVGVIGRNGAGKSTLFKLLSRITPPTAGTIDLYGRVGSLLEVGTGFSAELTGRENIYLNGTILGMKRQEIRARFDEIVEFSGVHAFLDTPVKRYSSGMYVRLAFAVAAHLDPEILIVDEVLSVGDAEFQEKCLGRIREVARNGRTVLFVSHNMTSVTQLCNRVLVMTRGKVAYDGNVASGAAMYLEALQSATRTDDSDARTRPGSGEYRFSEVEPAKRLFDSDEPKEITFKVRRRHGSAVGRMFLSAHVVDGMGNIVCQCDSRLVGVWLHDDDEITGSFRFDSPWLRPGRYRVDLYLCGCGIIDNFEDACEIAVSPVLPYAHSASGDGFAKGTVFADFGWSINAPKSRRVAGTFAS
jgi:lipopolysaccharide transport system ATP-binding protein